MTVPAYVFSPEWLGRKFIVPRSKRFRAFVRLKLEEWSGYGIMFVPGNEHVRKVLLERLSALNASYNQSSHDQWIEGDVPPYLFTEAWLDGNFLIITKEKRIRNENRDALAGHIKKALLHQPQHVKVLKEVGARLAAIEAYSKAKG